MCIVSLGGWVAERMRRTESQLQSYDWSICNRSKERHADQPAPASILGQLMHI